MTGLNDPAKHVEIEFPVLMHGNITEAHHALQRRRQSRIDRAGSFEEYEGIAHALGYAQMAFGNDVHRHVDRGLARALDVERESVEVREIIEPRRGRRLVTNATDAPFDDRRLVEQNVVRRRRHAAPPGGLPAGRHTSTARTSRTSR